MNNEIVFYSTPDGDKKVEVLFQDENFWLTQKDIARLFGVEVPAISKHLGNIYETGELERKSTLSILETVHQAGLTVLHSRDTAPFSRSRIRSPSALPHSSDIT